VTYSLTHIWVPFSWRKPVSGLKRKFTVVGWVHNLVPSRVYKSGCIVLLYIARQLCLSRETRKRHGSCNQGYEKKTRDRGEGVS
jgi:hypothetical protein